MSELQVSFSHMQRRGPLEGVILSGGECCAIAPAPDAARFILRGPLTHCTAFGPAPPEPLRASSAKGRAALWLGPDEALLLASGETAETILQSLEPELSRAPHSLVDVSHRQTGLILDGPLAARCLLAGCPLDLRLKAFPAGMAARTLFHKSEIILWRQDENRFHVEVWRSFAPYLVGQLAEVASCLALVSRGTQF